MPRIEPGDTLAGSGRGSGRAPLSAPVGRTPAKPPRPLEERARARPERPRSDRPTRWQLLRRRQRRLLRRAAWLAGVLLVAGGAVALGHWTQPGSRLGSPVGAQAGVQPVMQPGTQPGTQPVAALAAIREGIAGVSTFRVERVVVEGRTLTPEPLLRTALGVSVGDKLLGFSLDAARTRIEALTWVQHATVERRLPGTVVVQLTERRPFAVWQSGGRFVLIDRAGQVVAEQDPVKDAAAFAVLPLVVGPGAPEGAAGLLDLLAAQPVLKSRVVAAIRVGERRWNLRLNNGADVLLPEGQEGPAMARLMELHAAQALLDRPLQTLDMRLPDRLVVRPQVEPHLPAASGPRRPT